MERGRETKYSKQFDKVAYRLSLLGVKGKEFADTFDVSESTISEWKNKHESFKKSIEDGRLKADMEVAAALIKRAKGYRYKEEVKELVEDDSGNETLKVTKVTTKEAAPDANACMNWLKNRRPQDWKDSKTVQHEGELKLEDFFKE